MHNLRNTLLAAACAAALILVPASSAFARGGFRGGGFRVSPSLRMSGSARSFSGWGSATRPSLKASPFSASRPALSPSSTPRLGGISGTRSGISGQRGLYDSARRNGTLFSSKTEATQAFRNSYARDYSSSFASEPPIRPSYIPPNTYVGGRSVSILYNPALGGYGYIHPLLGTWMLFDALSDAAVLDHAMSSRGYYWGGAPVYVSHGPGFLGLALAFLALLIIASIVGRAAARRREWRE
jgi:hypothetical protein